MLEVVGIEVAVYRTVSPSSAPDDAQAAILVADK